MNCEECGSVMQWRSTNQVTHLSKFKCPNCGHVQVGENDVKLSLDEYVPKYYTKKNGRYIVKRTINHKFHYIASLPDESTAQKVVAELNKVDWDKSYLPSIFSSLGIHKVNRSWVCA